PPMAEQTSLVQEGIERFRGVVGALESEANRVQRDILARRRRIEKQLGKRFDAGRKDFERRARSLRGELRKSATLRWLEGLSRDAAQQLEEGVGGLLGRLQIASKSDVQRVDRKLAQLQRKLKELERSRPTNGSGEGGIDI
ncbi:MAG: hypothetical protein OEM49_13000, partial [Myxococcales bacterium]|nr:hypothetical protein [Myxococcales bacterium]